MAKKYAVRIVVRKTHAGEQAEVVFGQEQARWLRKERGTDFTTYVTVKRMADRLGFYTWDRKTERGMCALTKSDMVTFSRAEDIEVIREFEGEYDGLVDGGGCFFIKQGDAHVWTDLRSAREVPAGRTEKPVERTDGARTTVSPSDAIKPVLEALNAERAKLERELQEIEDMRRECVEKLQATERKARALKEALDIIEEVK